VPTEKEEKSAIKHNRCVVTRHNFIVKTILLTEMELLRSHWVKFSALWHFTVGDEVIYCNSLGSLPWWDRLSHLIVDTSVKDDWMDADFAYITSVTRSI